MSITRELTPRALILGLFLSLLFGISNAYLGLKVGTTIAASIPAAVLSMAILRFFTKRSEVLEHNMVQTIATVGEALAGGMIFTLPAIWILGLHLSFISTLFLVVIGGVLGILFMIPMRRTLIVEDHHILPFPEGTACAKILTSGAEGRFEGWLTFFGIGTGAFFKLMTGPLHFFNETLSKTLKWPKDFEFSMELSPALLGVGYLIGPKIAALMFGGGIAAWWIFIPLIAWVGGEPWDAMNAESIWSGAIRYIGAGAVAMGGILSLGRIFPIVARTFREGARELFALRDHRRLKKEQDISIRWLFIGSMIAILALWFYPPLSMNFLSTLLVVIFGYFFVAVTSMTVGIVGSSSNPVSGLTLCVVLLTSLIFLSLGWVERGYLLLVLLVSITVNVAVCMAGTTSQDLKTGFLVGASPKAQQIGQLLALIFPAIAIFFVIQMLGSVYGFGSESLPAPQATLMAIVAEGILVGNLPFFFVLLGLILGAILALCRVPVLPFAIGLYLPLSLSSAVMTGAAFSFLSSRFKGAEKSHERGTLISSGLVAGDACTGVLIAMCSLFLGILPQNALFPDYLALTTFLLLGAAMMALSHMKRTRLF